MRQVSETISFIHLYVEVKVCPTLIVVYSICCVIPAEAEAGRIQSNMLLHRLSEVTWIN